MHHEALTIRELYSDLNVDQTWRQHLLRDGGNEALLVRWPRRSRLARFHCGFGHLARTQPAFRVVHGARRLLKRPEKADGRDREDHERDERLEERHGRDRSGGEGLSLGPFSARHRVDYSALNGGRTFDRKARAQLGHAEN